MLTGSCTTWVRYPTTSPAAFAQQSARTQQARAELETARKNRDAGAGIFVLARSHAGAGFPTFARYGHDIMVLWDDENPGTDAYLQAALMVAVATNPNGLIGSSGRIGQKRQAAALLGDPPAGLGAAWVLAPRLTSTAVPAASVPCRLMIHVCGASRNGLGEASTYLELVQSAGGLQLVARALSFGPNSFGFSSLNATKEVELGETYTGTVTRTAGFGAFVEFMPGKDGLLHISEIKWERLENMEGVLEVGEEVKVKLIEIDKKTGKFRLSRKVLLPRPPKKEATASE